MGTSNDKPWLEKWENLQELSGGGQGTTYVVNKKGGKDEGEFVLKVLKSQRSEERRRRMRLEVLALEALTSSGIPRLIDSNLDRYKDLEEKLYFVAEYVPGQSLKDHISKGTVDVISSASFATRLLRILEECHSTGIVHRDIKPDNVILRNGVIDDPVLIDFGLSFNEEQETRSMETPSMEQLGNKFFTLPELQAGSENKRDFRSDLTFCSGIILFMVTGKNPVNLIDHEGQLPHQRKAIRELLIKNTGEYFLQLDLFFNTAFFHLIDRRFQSAKSMVSALERVLNKGSEGMVGDIEDKIKKLKEEHAQLQNARVVKDQALGGVHSYIAKVFTEVVKELDDWYEVNSIGYGNDSNVWQKKFGFVVTAKLDARIKFTTDFFIKVSVSEVVCNMKLPNKDEELFRVPISGFTIPGQIKSRIRQCIVEEIDSLYEKYKESMYPK